MTPKFNNNRKNKKSILILCALSVALLGIGASVHAATPYAYWKLDDGSGSVAVDSSGNGKTANLFNSPSWQSGTSCKSGSCLSFNGTNQYASSQNIDLSGTSAVTIAFWMNWTNYASDDKLAMEFTSNFNNANTGFMVDPNSSYLNSSGAPGNYFEAGLKGDAADGGYNQVLFARPSQGWHHFAFVLNKSNPAATEVIPYVDGVAVSYTKPTQSENANKTSASIPYI